MRLVLPQAEVLRRRVLLPLATEENLRQVLGFDLDRQTPFNAATAFYDVKIEQRDTTAGMLTAQLAATPKAEIEAVIATLARAGLTVRAIGVVDDLAGANPHAKHFDLFPPELRPQQKLTGLQILNRCLMIVVALLVLAVVFIPIWQKRENVLTLRPILEKSKSENEGTERVLNEVTRLATEYNFIATKKQTTQATVTLVEEFSKMLPDTTWLQTLEIKTTPKVREVQVQGETASATKLIELFEKSPLLQNTTTRSQVSRGAMPNTERFHIAADIKPRAIMDEKTALSLGVMPPSVAAVVAVTAPAAATKDAPKDAVKVAAKPPPSESTKAIAKGSDRVIDGAKTVPIPKYEAGKSDATKGREAVPAPAPVQKARADAAAVALTAAAAATPTRTMPAPTPSVPAPAAVATPLPPSTISGRPVAPPAPLAPAPGVPSIDSASTVKAIR